MLNGNSTVRVCPDASPIFSRNRKVLSSKILPLTLKSSDPPLRRGGSPFSTPEGVSAGSASAGRLSLLASRELDKPRRDLALGKPPRGASPASEARSPALPEGDGCSETPALA